MEKVLIIENSLCTPHTETALELYYLNKLSIPDTFVLPLYDYLPTNENNLWNNPETYKGKCRDLNKFLLKYGIQTVVIPDFVYDLDRSVLKDNSKERIDQIYHKGFPVGSYVKGMMHTIFRCANLNFNIKEQISVFKILYELAICSYEITNHLIRTLNFTKVYIFNGRYPTSAGAVHACIENGVDYYLHERGATLNKYLVQKGSFHDPENRMKNILSLTNDIDPTLIKLVGSKFFLQARQKIAGLEPGHARHQKLNTIPNHLNIGKYVVYFTNTEYEQGAYSDELADIGFKNQYNSILNVAQACKELGIHLVIRMHPNMANSDVQDTNKYRSLMSETVTIILPNDICDSYFLAENAYAVTTYQSTMGVESLFMGTPVIMLGKSLYYFCKDLMKPVSYSSLLAALKFPISPKDKLDPCKYGYYMSESGIEHHFYKPESLFSGTINSECLNNQIFGYLHQSKQ